MTVCSKSPSVSSIIASDKDSSAFPPHSEIFSLVGGHLIKLGHQMSTRECKWSGRDLENIHDGSTESG